MEKLAQASAAEAEAANVVWRAAQASVNLEEPSVSDNNLQAAEAILEGSDIEADVRLHTRAVCLCTVLYLYYGSIYIEDILALFSRLQVVVAREAVGNLGGMIRQLSLDQFENESRRMVPLHNDLSHPTKKFTRQKSPQGLHKKARFLSLCSVSK